jgi:16S rRNA (cytidine1402-2'-O)-methyltransferase
LTPRQTSHPATERPRRVNTFTVLGSQTPSDPIAPGLHLVATPIGNLGDITLRALATLAAADAVVAEDTRVSHNLLVHYGIEAPLIAYHEHNAAQMRPVLLARLAQGEALALISDAGTPLISDPGYKLVAEALAAGIAVTTAPGASSVLAALLVSGLPTDRFFFEGFLPPRSAARRARINELVAIPSTLVFFESPRRLAEMLADLAAELGPRPAAVARELTKFYESTRRARLDELAALYGAEEAPKGEIVVVVGPPEAGAAITDDEVDRLLADALASLSVKDAAVAIAARTGAPRRQIYARALALAGSRR